MMSFDDHATDTKQHASMPELLKAVKLAFDGHSGQKDKQGEPYFSHCKRVAEAVTGEDERTVAYLHDLVEKAPDWSLERLREQGFSPLIVDAVDALTKRPGEEEEKFVLRAASNQIARPVKIADLKDNLAQARKMNSDTSKYEHGLKIIERKFGRD